MRIIFSQPLFLQSPSKPLQKKRLKKESLKKKLTSLTQGKGGTK